MKTSKIKLFLAILIIWGCSKDEDDDNTNSGEPNFKFEVVGQGGNQTLIGKDIVFNSTMTDGTDQDGITPIEINSVAIVAQVPQGDTMASVLISITDRDWVGAGTHDLGTEILENYNAVVTYWPDTSAELGLILNDGYIKLDTRSNSLVSGFISSSGGNTSITGTFTAPHKN